MNRLPDLEILLELKEIEKALKKAERNEDVALVEELMEAKYQLEMELI